MTLKQSTCKAQALVQDLNACTANAAASLVMVSLGLTMLGTESRREHSKNHQGKTFNFVNICTACVFLIHDSSVLPVLRMVRLHS